MKTILMFNCDYANLYNQQDIKCLVIPKEKQHEKLGFLLQYFGFMANKKACTETFDDSLIIYDGFDEKSLDEALSIIKGKNVSLKAITTRNNIGWDAYKLFEELNREKKFIEAQKREG